MSDLLADVPHAVRRLRRSPGFTAVAVLTLGVGIGATTAVFSLVRSVLLAPLPYASPQELVDLSEVTGVERPTGGGQVAYPTYRDWIEGARSFRGIAAYQQGLVTVTHGTASERVAHLEITPNLFDVLGVQPAAGRALQEDEARAGNERVVILSHEYAIRRFGTADGAVGRTLVLNRVPATVVGVMPQGFAFPSRTVALWVPLVPQPWMENRGVHILRVVARLAPDAPLVDARGELAALSERLDALYGNEHPGHRATVTALQDRLVGGLRPLLRVLMVAVTGVLLIACANVAHLLLARATAQRGEMTIRAALGASRGRIVRQLLAEGITISLLGGLLGVGIAVWTVAFLGGRVPGPTGQVRPIAVDGMVLGFALAVSVVTGLAAAAAPAFRSARFRLAGALADAGTRHSGGVGSRRFRSGLVVVEVAVSLVLLLAGGLLLASFARVLRVDPGFRDQGVLTMAVSPSPTAAPGADAIVAFYRDASARIGALPGVEAVGAANVLPVSGGNSSGHLTIEGRTFAPGEEYGAEYVRVRPDYFRAMGIPLVQGREFDEADDGDPMVVILSAGMARRLWPDGDAIGRRIKIGVPEREPWLTVVGVVGDVHTEALDVTPPFVTYEPHAQRVWRTMQLAVRTAGDPLALATPVRAALQDLDAEVVIYDVESMEQRIGASLSARRFVLGVLGAFATVALILALVGVYAVIAYTVVQRGRELSIRVALGAQIGAVVRLVLGGASALIGAGIAVGLLLASFVLRGLREMLFEIQPGDPRAVGAVAVLLFAVAVLAAYVPARRAAHVDPMEALRHE